jgi:XRE family transcriptional regulator, aerobic/anaerobic benzoate catabolism transcriptional regulator
MSSNIVQITADANPTIPVAVMPQVRSAAEAHGEAQAGTKHPFLLGLGERVRALRSRRGMTRKALSAAADVSERHLANLEYGGIVG